MTTLDMRIEQLEAKDQIRELTARYCHAVVDGDAKKIVSLFCEEGRFITNGIETTGHPALIKFYESGVSQQTHKPFVQNHVIELTSEFEASGRCSVEIRVNQNEEAYTQAGHYKDIYKKIEGSWKFSERHYLRYHNAPWQSGWKAK